MPVFTNPSVIPRQELNFAIVEGQGAVKNLIGDKIMPSFPIERRTAHLIKATLSNTNALRTIDDNKFIHAPGTKFERMIATFGDATLTVTLRGVEIVVPNETEMDYDGFLDVEAFEVGRFAQNQALTNEKLIAAQIFNTANTFLNGSTAALVAYTAALSTTCSFITDVINSTRRIKALGELADTVVLSGPVYERIRQSAAVQAYVSGTLYPGADTSLNNIQKVLAEYGIKQVLVGDGYTNVAAGNAAASLSQIWSNTYVAVCQAGTLTGMSDQEGLGVPQIGGIGVNTMWQGYNPGGNPTTEVTDANKFSGGTYIESYPDFSINSMVIRCKMSQKPTPTNVRCMDLILTNYA